MCMTPPKIVEGNLLYHAVHGLCWVNGVMTQDQSGQKVPCYSLIPKVMNQMKTRFIIGVADIEGSGFHVIISPKEANKLLRYLKIGNGTVVPKNQTWDLAQTILSCAYDKSKVKDQRKRQIVERSVKGLVGELAFVFNMTLKETAEKIQKQLGAISRINPLVLAALAHAGEA